MFDDFMIPNIDCFKAERTYRFTNLGDIRMQYVANRSWTWSRRSAMVQNSMHYTY